jgi:flagellar basal-body rod modification protein FlgD
MQIQSSDFTTPLPADSTTGGSAATDASTAAEISSTDALGDESTFLQLLVAQIQNQDPTQPLDSSTFLTQLAEFSSVEQLIGIRQDVQELDPTSSTSATNPTSGN